MSCYFYISFLHLFLVKLALPMSMNRLGRRVVYPDFSPWECLSFTFLISILKNQWLVLSYRAEGIGVDKSRFGGRRCWNKQTSLLCVVSGLTWWNRSCWEVPTWRPSWPASIFSHLGCYYRLWSINASENVFCNVIESSVGTIGAEFQRDKYFVWIKVQYLGRQRQKK